MKKGVGNPLFSQAAATEESTPRKPRTERTSHILLKNERKKEGANNKASSSTYDHRDTTSAVSPSEHKQKSPAFIQKRAACVEDGLTESLYCRRRCA